MMPKMTALTHLHKVRSALGAFLSIGLCLFHAEALGAPIVIDDFSTSQSNLLLTFPPAGTSASSSVSGGGIFGAERDMQINLTAGVIAGNGMSAGASSGALSYSQDATIQGSLTCQWDGTDNSSVLNPIGLGGIDLTVGSTQDALLLSIIFDDLPTNLSVIVNTDAGNASVANLSLPGLIFSATNFVIPFSSFVTTLGAGADFANVGAISLSMGSNVTSPDVVIDTFQTAPLLSSTMAVALQVDGGTPGTANPGDTLRYTVALSNPNDALAASADGVQFAIPAIANTTLVAGSVTTTQGTVTTGNTAGNTSVAVNVGNIADAATVTITFDVVVNNPLPAGVTLISAQGNVSWTSIPNGRTDNPSTGTLDDATTIAVAGAPSLSATMRDTLSTDTNSNGSLNPGDTVRYTVVVTNSGNQGASGFSFISTLDAGTSLVVGSVITTSGTVSQGNAPGETQAGVVLGTIPGGGGTATITFDVLLPASGPTPRPRQISSFGRVTDGGVVMIPTNDPDTATLDDPTVTSVIACGNNAVDAGEACDDGNTTSGDGCSATCTVEGGANCGNNAVDAGEACDDGNTTSGDGCSATCTVEAGSGSCGNGVVNAGEACDDGNNIDGDNCSAICAMEVLRGGGFGCTVASQAANSASAVTLLFLGCLLLLRRRRSPV